MNYSLLIWFSLISASLAQAEDALEKIHIDPSQDLSSQLHLEMYNWCLPS
ncbi:MAG: hypothetical protein ACRESJ_01075 [Pseudomonas sp.]